jgi:small subunit ribosomal protein S8
MMSDYIADFLTKIRNALMAKHDYLEILNNKILLQIANILKNNGYIENINYKNSGIKKVIVLKLKYDKNKKPIIEGLKRISKPGLRIYKKSNKLPTVLGGLGLAIISTSKGIITCTEARNKNLGGEILCHIW